MAPKSQTSGCARRMWVCSLIVAVFTVNVVIITVYVRQLILRIPPAGPPPKGFQVQLAGGERDVLLATMDAFSRALTRAGLPFFMYGGTLLGSWRHHGHIPWDDDVDFAVPRDLKENVRKVLRQLEPHFVLDRQQGVRWKLYSSRAKRIRRVSWSFPFVDISFYHLNDTHVWDEDVQKFKQFIFPKDVVFPLLTRPFEGRLLPSPNKPNAMLSHNYDLNSCNTGSYSHRAETGGMKTLRMKCTELYSAFPFVHRNPGRGGGCNETVVLSGTVLSWVFMQDDQC